MKFKELRRTKKMTQTDVARAVGVSQQLVAKWEGGMAYPRAELGMRVAELLGVSIDVIYKAIKESKE